MLIYLVLLLIITLFYSSSRFEYFCPDKLTYNNYQYFLWNNKNIWNKFLTYYDYLNFYKFMQSNYSMKNIYCKPLYPIKNINDDMNSSNKNWKTNREFRYNLRI